MDVGGRSDSDGGWVFQLANFIGTNESALRLMLSLLAGYPLALIHRFLFYGKSETAQHIFFAVCGIWLNYVNFGADAIHPIANLLLMYVLLKLAPGTVLSVVLAFIINMTYVCIGYYTNMSGRYEIVWTTPHCVLTLRLIGLVIDIYDGRQKREHLSADQQATALTKVPSLLEMTGYIYFFGASLVGPQLPMRRYQDFVKGAFSDPVTGEKPVSFMPALLRLTAGVTYTAIFQVGALFFTDEFMLTSDFANLVYWKKCLYVAFWGRFSLYKYVACWLIAEGVCILTGITYNGKDENGNNLWDGCANVRIRKFETGMSMHSVVDAFNINTNKWMAKYLFKRLKFLGMKDVSHLITLMFLALWHGLYSGYFMNFFLEFFIIKAEKDMFLIIDSFSVFRSIRDSRALRPVVWVFIRLYVMFNLGFALVSFCLFSFDNWNTVYRALYYSVIVFYVGWFFLFPLFKGIILPRPSSKTKKVE